ncbi:unnamed protein product [Urochloa decumbens]|uniref:CASP-like protein n=1 Tax=Urochloa decumbens TaxID=240449 RepID=A0ABC9B5G1_9POAL
MQYEHETADCHVMPDDPPNGTNSLTFVLRICTLGLALASAIVMATASSCTISGDGGDDDDSTTVAYKDFPPFVYLVACNITAMILETAAVYVQYRKGGGGGNDEEPKVLPGVVLVVLDVTVQVLVYSSVGGVFAAVAAYGDRISACADAAGNFSAEVHRAKLLGFGAALAAALVAVVKDVPLPFSIWPISSE